MITFNSYYSDSGWLSPDSMGYLSLAQNLVDDNSFLHYDNYASVDKVHFAKWPIGYPLMIFFIAKTLGTSVFWASKVVNIISIAFILIILRKGFGRNSYIYSWIFFFNSFLIVFFYTWSESIFILGIVWFAFSIYNFQYKSENSFLIGISVLISSLFLFLSRYIGVFSLAVIFSYSLYFLIVKKDNYKFFNLLIICVANTIFYGLYLYYNKLNNGFSTGIPRISAPETNFQLLKGLANAMVRELWFIKDKKYSFFILGAFFSVIMYSFKVGAMGIRNHKSIPLWACLFFVGIAYLAFLICMRWTSHFDMFDLRLLSPASFLVFLSGINYIEKSTNEHLLKNCNRILILTTILSALMNGNLFENFSKRNVLTYPKRVERIMSYYDKVKKRSVVLCGDLYLQYLRPDIQVLTIKSKPLFEADESFEELIDRAGIEGDRDVYLDLSGVPSNYSKNLDSLVGLFGKNTLIKLK